MAYDRRGFQTVYGFHFMDELHNFFPEVLYDEQHFGSETMMWMRHRLRTLFPNVFIREQNSYNIYHAIDRRVAYLLWRNSQNFATAAPTTGAVAPAAAAFVTPTRAPVLTPSLLSPPPVRRMRTDPMISFMNILIDEELGNWANFMDVPVIPTAAQIAAGSQEVAVATVPVDTPCAICQERGMENDTWRRLHCNHYFHGRCIMPWFQQNAHCPVCRADVRNPNRVVSESVATAVAAQAVPENSPAPQ